MKSRPYYHVRVSRSGFVNRLKENLLTSSAFCNNKFDRSCSWDLVPCGFDSHPAYSLLPDAKFFDP